MEKFIKRIQVALDSILGVKASLEAELSKTNKVSENQNKVAESQAQRKEELNGREEAVKSIENVVTFKQAAEKVAKEVNDGRIALENKKQAFDLFVKNEKAALADKRTKVNELEASYNRELAALKKAREDVEKERASIGAEIVKNLANAVPKK